MPIELVLDFDLACLELCYSFHELNCDVCHFLHLLTCMLVFLFQLQTQIVNFITFLLPEHFFLCPWIFLKLFSHIFNLRKSFNSELIFLFKLFENLIEFFLVLFLVVHQSLIEVIALALQQIKLLFLSEQHRDKLVNIYLLKKLVLSYLLLQLLKSLSLAHFEVLESHFLGFHFLYWVFQLFYYFFTIWKILLCQYKLFTENMFSLFRLGHLFPEHAIRG